MANYSTSIRLQPEPLRSLAFGSISGTYAGIGTSLANPCRIIHFTNTTDVTLTISFDGINDHDVIAANGFLLIDVTTNHTSISGTFLVPQGQRFYVKGSPSLGSIYLAVYYGSNGN